MVTPASSSPAGSVPAPIATTTYTRIYPDRDGVSHFEDGTVALADADFAPPAPPAQLSAPLDSDRFLFITFPAGWFGDWHPAPRRQYFFQLSGELEVEVGDGELRRFAAGSVVLVEDVVGRGHTTRVLGDADVRAAVVQLPEGAAGG